MSLDQWILKFINKIYQPIFLGKYLIIDNGRIYNGLQKMFGSYIDKREYSFFMEKLRMNYKS